MLAIKMGIVSLCFIVRLFLFTVALFVVNDYGKRPAGGREKAACRAESEIGKWLSVLQCLVLHVWVSRCIL